MPTAMVDIRSCDSWWQRNGETVSCTHEHVSSSEGCAMRGQLRELVTAFPGHDRLRTLIDLIP